MDPRIVECPGRIQFRDMMEHRVQGQKYPVKYPVHKFEIWTVDINQINESSRLVQLSISQCIFRMKSYNYLYPGVVQVTNTSAVDNH